ncbi:uncharacterized protein LOC142229309 [Haematobia irritans]|uniref:uncharacterized protein LOC142229309 n=1 Tax=Haematobia irritans TaxID=7368 RepID=UPI003F4FA785
MKTFVIICGCLLVALVRADISEKLAEKNSAADKISDSNPKKRDASFVGGSSYHGPSYKYLPPPPLQGASVYDSYSTGGHHHSVGSSSFGSSGLGHSYSGHRGHHGGAHYVGNVGSVKTSGSHGFSGSSYPSHSYSGGHGYAGSSSGSHGYSSGGSGSHGYSGASYPTHSYAGGHSTTGSHGYSGSSTGSHGYTGSSYPSHSYSGGHSTGSHSYSGGHSPSHGFSSSSVGHKVVPSISVGPSYSLSAGHVGTGAGLGGGYHYAKGISGSLPAASSAGHGFSGHSSATHGYTGHGIVSGVSGHDDHHHHHVHNGNQEHHYIVSALGHDSGISHSGASDQGYQFENPSNTYLPPAVPSNSYGVPLATVGSGYSTKHQNSGYDAPVYAAGHKGLGHFGFTNNKPNTLHTSFIGSDFKTTSYSKVPFKPSTFLGAKFEGSATSGAAVGPSQHYLPPSGVAGDSVGYDYPVPTGPALQFNDQSFQTAVDTGTSNHQPESTYLPPHEATATPSASYLPPTGNSYGH